MIPLRPFVPEDIRNVALVGHTHCGKTAIAEAILLDEGATTRLGRTETGTSAFDFEPEEIHRGGSITSHFGWVFHNNRKINIIDTPGDQNFFLDGLTSLLGADGAVVVVGAPDGVQLQTRRAWAAATERQLPRAIFANKMDRFSGDWKEFLRQAGKALNIQPVATQVPVGKGESFRGVVDLFSRKWLRWEPNGTGAMTVIEPPPEMAEEITSAAGAMMDAIVSTDDEVLEKFLESGEVGPEVLRKTFVQGLKKMKLVPVVFGSASLNMGVQPLLDILADVFPSPIDRGPVACKDLQGNDLECPHNPADPFLAQVIHTFMDEHAGQISVIRIFSGEVPKDSHITNVSTKEEIKLGSAFVLCGKERAKIDNIVCGDIISAVKLKNTHTNNTLCHPNRVRFLPGIPYPKPMMSYVLIPQTKNDDDRMKSSLDKLVEEDPTLSISIDDLSHRMILSGMGHGHLENAVERLKRKYTVNVTTDLPLIAYRETFAKRVTDIEGKHKKQTGGAGQFGVCVIDVEPLPRDKGFEFVNDIFGGSIPKPFIPSVEKGVVQRMQHGLLAGYPVVDFRVILKDGKHHPVDSKDIAFQMAGIKAMKLAMEKAGMKILEPYYKMEIVVPSENSGPVMSDISTRRGHIDGMDTQDRTTTIYATCPMAEIQRYVPDLHSMTGGKGTFTLQFDSYRDVPDHLAERIRNASPFKSQAAAEVD